MKFYSMEHFEIMGDILDSLDLNELNMPYDELSIIEMARYYGEG